MTKMNSMECVHLIDYLLGELSDRELENFYSHAAHCLACKEELNVMLPIHLQLSECDMDIPDEKWFAEQKRRLLQPALSNRKSANTRVKRGPIPALLLFLHQLDKKVWQSSAIALFILTAGFGLTQSGLFRNVLDVNKPVSPLAEISLTPNQGYPNAQGKALVVNNHDQENLILTVSHVPEQSKWGCYDVWGLKGRDRYSLGEFTVDHRGNGALTMNLPRDGQYDSIEVTLEPYWGDNTPLGPQVFTGPWGTT